MPKANAAKAGAAKANAAKAGAAKADAAKAGAAKADAAKAGAAQAGATEASGAEAGAAKSTSAKRARPLKQASPLTPLEPGIELGLLELTALKPHEEILPERLREMIDKIKRRDAFHKPILVDKASLTILDGHHKYNAALRLGLKRVPVALVEYLTDERIQVVPWPESGLETISKEEVVAMGNSEQVYPPKSSRHSHPFELPKLRIPLKKLKD